MWFRKKKVVEHPDLTAVKEKVTLLTELNAVKDHIIAGKDKQITTLREEVMWLRTDREDIR